MGKGGGGSPPPQNQTVTQTNLPEYARPYFEDLLGAGGAQVFTRGDTGQVTGLQPYQRYENQRIAGFADPQIEAQKQVSALQTPGQFGAATGFTSAGGLQALAAGQYQPGQFNVQQVQSPALMQYQMGPARGVSAQQVRAPQMATAQTGFDPRLNMFQMGAPEQFGQAQAEQYMSPYMQQVVDAQKREAIRDAQKAQLSANLAAPRQGTYGGARQLLAQTERERALGTQLGDIQSRGLQSAFESAQQQFERDRSAGMTAQQRNLEAALGVQQLGTQTGLQASLANLSSAQQANVQNQAAQLQAMGMNQEQALRAALANQQAGLTVGQQNLQSLLQTQQLGSSQGMQAALANQQAGLDVQKMLEQSRQFGSNLGLQGAQTALQAGETMGRLGTAEQQADLQRLQAQAAVGAEQRALEQQRLDMAYADFLRQRDYPMEQLGYFSNLLRGLPMTMGSTQTTYAQPPSMASQVGGLGLSALGLSNLMKG